MPPGLLGATTLRNSPGEDGLELAFSAHSARTVGVHRAHGIRLSPNHRHPLLHCSPYCALQVPTSSPQALERGPFWHSRTLRTIWGGREQDRDISQGGS